MSDIKEMNFGEDDFATFRLHPGDVLLNEGSGSADEVGKSAIWEGQIDECCYQNTLLRFRSDHLEPKFSRAFFYLAARSGYLVEHTQGVNIFHIGKKRFEEFLLPVAPVAEQRRIVAKLDALLARVARARAELQRIPILARELRNAALTYAWNEAHKFGAVTVGDLSVTTFDGPFGSNLKSTDYRTNGVRVVRLENIGHLTFITDKETFISKEKFSELTRHRLLDNDILFSSFVDREVRVCCFRPGDGREAINKADCFVVRVDTSLCDVRFVTYMLASPATYELMRASIHGATRPRIGLSQLRAHAIHLPPIGLQRELVGQLDSAFARADRLEAEAARARALLDRLEAAILAKAFRGELVPQDPADEPASVLLERIRARRAAAPAAKRGRRAKAAERLCADQARA